MTRGREVPLPEVADLDEIVICRPRKDPPKSKIVAAQAELLETAPPARRSRSSRPRPSRSAA